MRRSRKGSTRKTQGAKGRKTRRTYNQYGGGKLSLVPFAGTPAPGAPFDPSVESRMKEDMRDNWDYKIISAHGTLVPSKYTAVPANTYIVFNAPTGCVAIDTLVPAFETTTATDYPTFIEQLFKAHKLAIDNIFFIQLIGKPLVPGNSLLRTLAPRQRQALLACLAGRGAGASAGAGAVAAGAGAAGAGASAGAGAVGATTNLSSLYPPGFNDLAVVNRTVRAECFTDEMYTAKTIYGPGEMAPEMELAFENGLLDRLLIGVYNLPIPTSTYDKLTEDHKKFKLDNAGTIEQYKSQTPEQQEKILARFRHITRKADADSFSSTNGNLRPDLLTKRVTLTNVLDGLPSVPVGKNRFIFVTSCRGIRPPARNLPGRRAEAATLARITRAASVSEANAEIDVLRADAVRLATNYEKQFEGATIGASAETLAKEAALAADPRSAVKALLRERENKKARGEPIPIPFRSEIARAIEQLSKETGKSKFDLEKELVAELSTEAAGGAGASAAGGAGAS